MHNIKPFIIILKYKQSEIEVGVEPLNSNKDGTVNSFQIYINEQERGLLLYSNKDWTATDIDDPVLVNTIGRWIKKIFKKVNEFTKIADMGSICLN